MAYLGKSLDYGTFPKQVLSTNGSTTVFDLDQSVKSGRELIVSVGGVVQEPEVVYSASGTSLTFTTAPASAHRTWIVFLGKELSDSTFQTNVMTAVKFQANTITSSDITTLAANKLTGALPAISGSSLTGITVDVSAQEENIALLGFKMASAENLAAYALVDQNSDEYYDATGITAYNGTAAVPEVVAVGELEDASPSGHTVVVSGNVTSSTTQAKVGTKSLYFDGSGDYLTIANHADFNFTTDWTVEFWTYKSTNASRIFYMGTKNSNGAPDNDNAVWNVNQYLGSMDLDACNTHHVATSAHKVGSEPTATPLNVWVHFAFVRTTGNVMKIYRDGAVIASTTSPNGSPMSTNNDFMIGGGRTAIAMDDYIGYLDEIRVSKTARYTGTFTPSTTAFTNDSDTVFLVHGDAVAGVAEIPATPGTGSSSGAAVGGSNPSKYYSGYAADSTGIEDASSSSHVVTAVGGVSTSTSEKKFGTSSFSFDGVVGSYYNVADSTDWDVGAASSGQTNTAAQSPNSYTVEFWVKLNSLASGYCHLVGVNQESFNWGIYMRNDGHIVLGWMGNWAMDFSTPYITTGTWHHVAIVKNVQNTYCYFNGVELGRQGGSLNENVWHYNSTGTGTGGIGIGGGGAFSVFQESVDGYMDDIRISNTARYAANFTPPTVAHTSDANTLLLMSADISTASNSMDLVSTTTTANDAAITTADMVLLAEDSTGTATINTDVIASASRDGGTNYVDGVLVNKGTWGTGKNILATNDITIPGTISKAITVRSSKFHTDEVQGTTAVDTSVAVGTDISGSSGSGWLSADYNAVYEPGRSFVTVFNDNFSGEQVAWSSRASAAAGGTVLDLTGDVGEFGSWTSYYKASAFSFGGLYIWSGHNNSNGAKGVKDMAVYTSTDTTNGTDGTWTIQEPLSFIKATTGLYTPTGGGDAHWGQRESAISTNHFIVSDIIQSAGRNIAYADQIAFSTQSVKGIRVDIRTGWYSNTYPTEKAHFQQLEIYDDMGVALATTTYTNSQATQTLTEGYTYKFDQSDSTNTGHPLRLSTTSDGTHGGGAEYTTGVTTNGTPGSAGAYTQIVVESSAPTLNYYCSNHASMGGVANTPVETATNSMRYKISTANQSYTAGATLPQGYAGGSTYSNSAGSGGGGAGAVGVDNPPGGGGANTGIGGTGTANGCGGNGGIGLANDITGTSLFYAGGGGGTGGNVTVNNDRGGPGGSGVGGNGSEWGGSGTNINSTAGAVNTGSGGGGTGSGGGSGTPTLSGHGGSGIVVIRALTSETSGSTGNWDTTATDGSYTYYKWTTVTSAGTFTASQTANYEYLVVAGGGAGGGYQTVMAGGGGAGGYRAHPIFSVTGTISGITVGAGGTQSANAVGGSGANSVFSTITATGGGGGGAGNEQIQPTTGGSGGGAGGKQNTDQIGAAGNIGGNNTATAATGKVTRVHATSLAWKA